MSDKFEQYLFTRKTRRGSLWIFFIFNLGISTALTIEGGFHGYFWWPLFLQLAFIYVLYRDLSTGRTWVRTKTFSRKLQPLRYWFSIFMLAVCYLMSTVFPIAMYIREKAKA